MGGMILATLIPKFLLFGGIAGLLLLGKCLYDGSLINKGKQEQALQQREKNLVEQQKRATNARELREEDRKRIKDIDQLIKEMDAADAKKKAVFPENVKKPKAKPKLVAPNPSVIPSKKSKDSDVIVLDSDEAFRELIEKMQDIGVVE